MSERPHGYARYKLNGCRCYVCGYAVAQYRDAREHAVRRGKWQPFVDAEPVRIHVRNLQACGLGLRRIADLADIDRQRLQALLNGRPERGTAPQSQVRPALAAAIMRVQPTLDSLGSATVVGAAGTQRRLQALVAAGWPQAHLASGLGMTPGNFGRMLASPDVLVRTARAVRDLYDQTWRTDPAQHGVSPGGITRAKRYAAARNWAPVGAWDDDTIDDPTATPDCGDATPKFIALSENAFELERQGHTREQAADRLGVTTSNLQQAISRYRKHTAAAA